MSDQLESELTACRDCADSNLKRVEHPAAHTDWRERGSSQGYAVYRCEVCGDYWGVRYQYDPGTGADDRWHRFGAVNPSTIRRHY